ncbi:MAG: aspartate/glutamate racemase family protein [Hyphomicrobiales bacterium]|nr:aspartate/glutamate racemase family protein [Hyphomicrobiales bacterium]
MTDARRPLGVLMLDTDFERPPGDVGNPESWPFPVLFETIRGAFPRAIVDGDDDALVDAFVAGAVALKARGAVGAITSCGFLGRRQRELAARTPLPFASSALLLLPTIAAALPPGVRPGVVTYDASRLGRAHFRGAGADPATPCVGLPDDGAFRALIEKAAPYDHDALEKETLRAVETLISRHPDVGAIVFECTNLPPFSPAVRTRFGLPVHDILTLGMLLHAGLTQIGYGPHKSPP